MSSKVLKQLYGTAEQYQSTLVAVIDFRLNRHVTSCMSWELLFASAHSLLDGRDEAGSESLREELARDGTVVDVTIPSDVVRMYVRALPEYAHRALDSLEKRILSSSVSKSECRRIRDRLSARAQNALLDPLAQISSLASLAFFEGENPMCAVPYGRPHILDRLDPGRIACFANSISSKTDVSVVLLTPQGSKGTRLGMDIATELNSANETLLKREEPSTKLNGVTSVLRYSEYVGSTAYISYVWNVSSASTLIAILGLDVLSEVLKSHSGEFFQQIRDAIGASHILSSTTKHTSDASIFSITVTSPASRVDQVSNSVRSTVEKFLAGPYLSQEIVSAKQRIIARRMDNIVDDPLGQRFTEVAFLDTQISLDYLSPPFKEYLNTIRSLETKQLEHLAVIHLSPVACLEIRLMPMK